MERPSKSPGAVAIKIIALPARGYVTRTKSTQIAIFNVEIQAQCAHRLMLYF